VRRGEGKKDEEGKGVQTMKAVVLQAGSKFTLEEIPKPELKGNRDVIVRVTTAAICGSDVHAKHGLIPGYTPGTIMGHEFVGVVD
jgi:threonine dehydrogenase-like Zn-dependent dehydrogenase